MYAETIREEKRAPLNAPECAAITAFPNVEIRTLQLTRFVQRGIAAGLGSLARARCRVNGKPCSERQILLTVGPAIASFALTALAIIAAWWWLGAPVELPKFDAGAGKLYCLSYAPFRGGQNPLVEGTRVDARQIDEDLALLAKYTNCIRTYSVDDGRDDVLKSARRYGLKVLHGIWVSHDVDKTRQQVETTIALAKAYPDVIKAVVVGNEVLLRGEMSAASLSAIIRDVKAAVAMPVTYADVWEFWLRYPDVQNAVDFVTVHILPYWEDFPIPASRAAEHVADIRGWVAAAFPGKEIVVGEFGWPSEGRMREAARPSPSNQALALTETLALAAREHFQLNVIEAFDQPWKRALEGTVGGYWGIIDRATGAPKFNFAGGGVSDHPNWPIQALTGIILAALAFGGAGAAAARKGVSAPQWALIAGMVFVSAVAFGWTIETVAVESFSIGVGCVRLHLQPRRRPRRLFAPSAARQDGRRLHSPISLAAGQHVATGLTGRSAAF